jgi:hypothetical protein
MLRADCKHRRQLAIGGTVREDRGTRRELRVAADPAPALVDHDRAALERCELDGHAAEDAVSREREGLIALRGARDSEGCVCAVVALPHAGRTTHGDTCRRRLPVLPDGDLHATVRRLHEVQPVVVGPGHRAAGDLLGAEHRLDGRIPGEQPDVDLTLRGVANLDDGLYVDGECGCVYDRISGSRIVLNVDQRNSLLRCAWGTCAEATERRDTGVTVPRGIRLPR